MAINYADKFENILVQKYEAESKSNDLTLSNPQVKFMNAQTIKLPHIVMSGYKDHARTPGFNAGTISNDWEPKKLEFDRDIEFWVDPMDIDETNLVLSVANLQSTFETEQAIPETDCFRFSKLYSQYATTYSQTVDHTTITTANFLDAFDTWMAAMDEAGVPEEGRILYLTPTMNKIAKNAQGLQRNVDVMAVGAGGAINRKVYSLDDVKMIKVPAARMKTAYDFTNGFAPAVGAKQINMMLVHPNSVVARAKYAYIHLFTPGTDSRTADGYLFQNRKYQDLFLLSQRLEGVKINADQ